MASFPFPTASRNPFLFSIHSTSLSQRALCNSQVFLNNRPKLSATQRIFNQKFNFQKYPLVQATPYLQALVLQLPLWKFHSRRRTFSVPNTPKMLSFSRDGNHLSMAGSHGWVSIFKTNAFHSINEYLIPKQSIGQSYDGQFNFQNRFSDSFRLNHNAERLKHFASPEKILPIARFQTPFPVNCITQFNEQKYLCCSQTSPQFAICSRGDAQKPQVVTLEIPAKQFGTCLAPFPDSGQLLAGGCRSGRIYIWDIRGNIQQKPVLSIGRYPWNVVESQVSSNSTPTNSSFTQQFSFLDSFSNKIPKPTRVTALVTSPTQSNHLYSGHSNGSLYCWDVRNASKPVFHHELLSKIESSCQKTFTSFQKLGKATSFNLALNLNRPFGSMLDSGIHPVLQPIDISGNHLTINTLDNPISFSQFRSNSTFGISFLGKQHPESQIVSSDLVVGFNHGMITCVFDPKKCIFSHVWLSPNLRPNNSSVENDFTIRNDDIIESPHQRDHFSSRAINPLNSSSQIHFSNNIVIFAQTAASCLLYCDISTNNRLLRKCVNPLKYEHHLHSDIGRESGAVGQSGTVDQIGQTSQTSQTIHTSQTSQTSHTSHTTKSPQKTRVEFIHSQIESLLPKTSSENQSILNDTEMILKIEPRHPVLVDSHPRHQFIASMSLDGTAMIFRPVDYF